MTKIDPEKAKERVYQTLSRLHPTMKEQEISEIIQRIVNDPDFLEKYHQFMGMMNTRLKRLK